MSVGANQLDYKRKLEADFSRRIEEILSPVVGTGSVKAQVVSEVDFTVIEETSEKYNNERALVRSEQTVEESNNGGAAAAAGIPGALSNQPPVAASAPETAKPAAKGASAPAASGPSSASKRATRNFEIDKTISYTKQPSGTVKRLTVAVVVDDVVNVSKKGKVTRKPRTEQEIERYTALVKEAIGFDEKRGDRVNVTNATFATPPAAEALPEIPVWKQDWVWDLAKQIGGALLVLIIFLKILKPLLKTVAPRPPVMMAPAMLPGGMTDDRVSLGANGTPIGYEAQMSNAKTMAAQDPRRVAQVMKNWVSDGG
jgi:flagellar M-ring protein FliF